MWLSCDRHMQTMWLTKWLPGGDITPSPGVGNHVEVMTSSDPCRRGAQLSLKFSCPVKEVHSFLERHGVMVRQRSYVDKGNNVTPLFKHWEDCRNALKCDLRPSSLPLGMKLALYSSLFLLSDSAPHTSISVVQQICKSLVKSCNTIDLPHMNLIIFPHLSMVFHCQLACCKTFAICCSHFSVLRSQHAEIPSNRSSTCVKL